MRPAPRATSVRMTADAVKATVLGATDVEQSGAHPTMTIPRRYATITEAVEDGAGIEADLCAHLGER